MAMTTEAKRVKTGNSLLAYKTQIQSAVAQLTQIKTQLSALKTQLNADNDFAETDVAEVDALITECDTEISNLSK